MKLVITDVSVLFDLYHLKVLHHFFNQKWEIYTTDFVYNEIVNIEQVVEFEKFVSDKLMKIITISADETEAIGAMTLNRRNRSFPDRSILWKAIQFNSILLTCDRVLRKEAELKKIEVHGTIWVIEKLIENGLVTKPEGVGLLKSLMQTNSRTPKSEIDKIIDRLK